MSRIPQLEELLRSDPTDPFLHFALAKEYESAKEYNLARKRYELLLEQHAGYTATYYHIGKLYEKMSEPVLARAAYEQGILKTTELGEQHALSELKTALSSLEFDL